MRQYAVELPEALLHAAQEVAQAEQTSLDAFMLMAIAEKIAAARTAQYVHTRAARGNPQAFLAVLERIKQAAGPVVEGDELSLSDARQAICCSLASRKCCAPASVPGACRAVCRRRTPAGDGGCPRRAGAWWCAIRSGTAGYA